MKDKAGLDGHGDKRLVENLPGVVLLVFEPKPPNPEDWLLFDWPKPPKPPKDMMDDYPHVVDCSNSMWDV